MQFFSTATSIPPTTLSATTIQYLSNQIIQYAAQVRLGKPCSFAVHSLCRDPVQFRQYERLCYGAPHVPKVPMICCISTSHERCWIHLQKGTEANGIIIHWVSEAGRPDSTNVTSVATSYILSRVEVRSGTSVCTQLGHQRSQHPYAQPDLKMLGASIC